MKRLKIIISLITLLLLSVAGYTQIPGLSQALPVDKNYKIGRLENGLTYYIRHAQNPKGRVEFFIVHNVGSLQENEDQRGLAHFLEHMAFNGTKHFPDKLLLNYFAGIGVKFGANINAYTSMERTVYNISAVPADHSPAIDSALLALHDWSHYISCEPDEIEAERGVVREEWRRGDDSRTRMMKGINRAEQTGSRFAERDVIGLPEIINTFTRETLIDYYHKWYRPDLQAVIVVGDINPQDIEERIIKRFSTIPKVENGAKRESYSIPDNKKPIVAFNTDPETRALSVRMTVKIPHLTTQQRQTNKALHEELVKYLFLDMFKIRAQVAAEGSDSLVRSLIPVFGDISYASGKFTLTGLPVDNKSTLSALRAIFNEIERVRQHGFDQEEFDASTTRVMRQIEANYNRSKNPKNSDFVSFAVDHFTRQYPLLDIDEYYSLSKEMLGQLVLQDVNSNIERLLSAHNRVIIFSVPESDAQYLPDEDEVLELLDEVMNSHLEKFIPVADKKMKFSQIITPGRVISERTVTSDDLNIKHDKQLDSTTEWILENGARIIWKEEYGKDKNIRMTAFRPGGYAYPQSPEQIKLLESFLLNYSFNGFNRNELGKWFLSNNVSVKPGIRHRDNEITGNFEVKGINEFFNILNVFLTSASADRRDVENLKTRLLKNLTTDAGETNRFRDSVTSMRFSSNPMSVKFTPEFVDGITAEILEELYRLHFANPAGYTFIFTGPLNASEAKGYIEKYIGSIKNDSRGKLTLNPREPQMQKGEVYLRYKAKNMLSTKAGVTRVYSGNASYTTENNLVAKFITYILRDRYMKSIREEKGGTYYVGVSGDLIREPDNIARFSVEFDTDPSLVDDLLEVVQHEIDILVEKGPLERELKETTLYLEKVYNDHREDPSWLSIISGALKGVPDITSGEKKLLEKIDAEAIHKFAKSIFTTGNKMTFIFEPEL